MDMDMDNVTVLFTATELTSAYLLGTLHFLGVSANVIILIIIIGTAGMRGFSGALMINKVVAEIIQEIITLTAILVAPYQLVQFQIYLRLSLFALQGVVSHSICALSVNLYLAICKQLQYRSLVTWERIYKFLACSWIFNIVITSTYHFLPSMYTVDFTSLNILHIHLTPFNFWILLIMILNIIVVPFCLVMACFLKFRISTHRLSMMMMSPRSVKKVKMSQFIHTVAAVYLLTLIPLLIAISVEVPLKGFKAIAWTVNSIYHILKPFLYVKLYKPFRETVNAMRCNSCEKRVYPKQLDQNASDQTSGGTSADGHNQCHNHKPPVCCYDGSLSGRQENVESELIKNS
ncbi:mu-type opioid receptor-like [Haliotis rubra]|uniref:mu-type opioid receptor-like n=1 Tax=Haliotis rubra TaxID=36100 RepID=UPI001EE56958|nr:mu-type opioid receptor-like [Haliotis rubra]